MALSLQRRASANELKAVHTYSPTRLVDEHGNPVRTESLRKEETYIFHFPYLATPCFLIDLEQPVNAGAPLRTEDGRRYQWPGGAGPNRTIVAFSAICAHKMTHPAKSVSFINYRPETINYINTKHKPDMGKDLIYCCSERSVYDVRDGARVLGGPAGQPLAAIGLDYDPATDSLAATGTFGGEMFEQFFKKFTSRLQLEYKVTNVDARVGETTIVQHIEDFSRTRVMC
jgi:Rieske Fe-S protein